MDGLILTAEAKAAMIANFELERKSFLPKCQLLFPNALFHSQCSQRKADCDVRSSMRLPPLKARTTRQSRSCLQTPTSSHQPPHTSHRRACTKACTHQTSSVQQSHSQQEATTSRHQRAQDAPSTTTRHQTSACACQTHHHQADSYPRQEAGQRRPVQRGQGKRALSHQEANSRRPSEVSTGHQQQAGNKHQGHKGHFSTEACR